MTFEQNLRWQLTAEYEDDEGSWSTIKKVEEDEKQMKQSEYWNQTILFAPLALMAVQGESDDEYAKMSIVKMMMKKVD